jgi:hypothetical protein
MTTYRFPADLGGGEHEEYRPVAGADSTPPVGTLAFLLDGCLVCVARGLLTEVKPPEPPVGFYLATHKDGGQAVVERDGGDWYVGGVEGPGPWGPVRDNYDTFTRLVPDPFAVPVELPWEYTVGASTSTGVTCGKRTVFDLNHGVGKYTVQVTLTPGEARAKACALWAAAAEAEATS